MVNKISHGLVFALLAHVLRCAESGLSPPTGTSFVYKEGWLEKQGSKVKTWKKRWFVLHRPAQPGACFTLRYYTAQNKAVEKVSRPV